MLRTSLGRILPAIVLLVLAAPPEGATAARGPAEGRAAGVDSTRTPSADDEYTPNSDLDVVVPRATGRPRIDGILDDPMWAQAVRLGNFCEISPGDNVRPQCETEALFAYDDENFYMGFICHDDSPRKIRASVADRDEMFSDDFAGIILDTFGDKQTSYEFFINPHGVQGDLRRVQNSEDESFDTVWQSGGHINSRGWTGEAAIPFRSLRFPDRYEQEWLVHILRIRPRDSREQDSWAPISRDESCLLCQAARFRGIKGVNRGRNLEFLPYVIASESGALRDGEDPSSGFHNGDPMGEAGFGVKYGVTPNLTLDFTYNPDFSQVESDAAQVDVNTTFALFFPEKRPFFLEGSEIFQTENLIYTRSVNDPMLAAKLTGRVGKLTLGYVLARDDASPFVVPFEDNSEIALGGKSVSNVLRLKRDVLSDSYVGLIATDRRLEDGGNSILVADGDVRFLENYRLSGQLGYSHTREPNDPALSSDFTDTTFAEGKYTSVFDGESFDGQALRLEFDRDARHLGFEMWYNDMSPTFRANNGFITNNNYRSGGLWTGVLFRPTHSVIETVQPQFNYGREYNHEDVFKDTWTEPSIYIRFKKQTGFWAGYIWSKERFKNVLVNGIERFEGNVESDAIEALSGGFYWKLGRSVVRSVDVPYLGHERVLEVWGTVKPSSRLSSTFDFTHARMDSTSGGNNVYNGYIFRNRLAYQFSRRFFMRLVTQYNDFNHRFEVDPLFSYKINPFTVFYIGSTHDFEKFKGSDYEGDPGYKQTDRQFFAKIQYLFRI
jgi:hypothetical protein